MGDGLSTARATSVCTTAVAAWSWTQLHTGAPGSAGTANVSSTTARKATTWATASGASVSANGTLPAWSSWSGTNGEVVHALSGWDASSSGNYQAAVTLSADVTMNTGDALSLTALTVSVPAAS